MVFWEDKSVLCEVILLVINNNSCMFGVKIIHAY